MRFSRFSALIGEKNFQNIATKKVIIFGLGGVGSFAAEALSRSGIGTLYLVDYDVIEPSNMNRQLLALEDTIGLYKADVMKSRIASINPLCQVFVFKEKVTASNLHTFLDLDFDYIVDCIDDVEAKVALIKKAILHNQLIISSMGFANKLHPELIEIATLSKTSVCPLAKVIRSHLRLCDIPLSLPVVFSKEKPLQTKNPDIRLGSSSFVPSAAGLLLASFVINQFLSMEEKI
ncbi:MAG: tRNA threonylcarbamoyladenosine dehydratase [Firmicutes bacterium]|nr:tRNA threonylcarbamoyladenosine dehydratase [Bacillota bacterium]